jgi:hypothetical protein
VRDAIRLKHCAYSTEKAYVYWTKRFVLYHNMRHPLEMGEEEISEFLTYLAVEENVAASTQNRALSALLFLYREVLRNDLDSPLELLAHRKRLRLFQSRLHRCCRFRESLLCRSKSPCARNPPMVCCPYLTTAVCDRQVRWG